MNNQIVHNIISIWHGITFGTKFVLISSLIVYGIDYLLDDMLFNIFADNPLELKNGQIWRILFPQFFHGIIYNLVVSLFCFQFSAVEFEKAYGTIPFFYDIFLKNILIQVIFIILCFSVYTFYDAVEFESFGFWNLTLMYMIQKGLQNGDEPSKFLCIPLQLKAKYYPLIFFIIMNIIEPYRLDLVAAFILAVFEYKLFNGFLMKPSKNIVNILEQSIIFRKYQSRPDFITCDQINPGFIVRDFSTQYSLEIQDVTPQGESI